MSGGRAIAGNVPIPEMVGAAQPGYIRDKGGDCSSGGGGWGQGSNNWR